MPIDIIPPGSSVLAHQTATVTVYVVMIPVSRYNYGDSPCQIRFTVGRSLMVGYGLKDCASIGAPASTAYDLAYDPSPTGTPYTNPYCSSTQQGYEDTTGGTSAISETVALDSGKIREHPSTGFASCVTWGGTIHGSAPYRYKDSPGEDVTDCTITGTV